MQDCLPGMNLGSQHTPSNTGRSGRSQHDTSSMPEPSSSSSTTHDRHYDAASSRGAGVPSSPSRMPSEWRRSRTSHPSQKVPSASSSSSPQPSPRPDMEQPALSRTLGVEEGDFHYVPMRSLGQLADLYLTLHGYSLPAQRFVIHTYFTVRDEATFVSVLGRRGVPDSELRYLYEVIRRYI